MNVVGFAGTQGVGKDTAGQYLVDYYGFTRLAFADKVKDCVAELLNIPRDLVDVLKNDPQAKVVVERDGIDTRLSALTFRRVLQRMGTEVGRGIFGEDVWIDLVYKDMDLDTNYVITDVRFPNEAEFVQEMGKLVYLERPQAVGISTDHPVDDGSQKYEYDFHIMNDRDTTDWLYADIDQVMESLNLSKSKG